MPTAAHVLSHLGDLARGTTLRQFGLSRRMLSSAVRDGTITRVRNGVFATPSAPADVLTAAAHGGALTCSRALRLHGIWTLEDDTNPHVWLGTHGRNHHIACTCTGHYFGGRTVLGLAPLEDALVHVYLCKGDESFFVSIESALQLRKIGAASRARVRSRLPAKARWLVDLARTDADSGLESLLRLRLHLLGIRLECQVDIPSVGRVDFVLHELLILEADGAENHDSASHRHRDLLRDAEASRQGYETLRFDYAMIVHDWPVVEAAILAAVDRLRARI